MAPWPGACRSLFAVIHSLDEDAASCMKPATLQTASSRSPCYAQPLAPPEAYRPPPGRPSTSRPAPVPEQAPLGAPPARPARRSLYLSQAPGGPPHALEGSATASPLLQAPRALGGLLGLPRRLPAAR